ncbi:MAG: hypothetical protein DRJ03_31310, partial [Chloroflexi bacterium]
TKDLVKKYKVTDKTVQTYRKRVEDEKKLRAPGVLDIKRALDLAKADSLLVLAMENMATALKRIDEDHEKYSPMTQAKVAVDCARSTLEIRNALIFTEAPELPEGEYGGEDVELQEMVMDMLTEKQKEELFEKFTGKPLAEVAPKRRNSSGETGTHNTDEA